MAQIEDFTRSVGRWLVLICAVGAAVLWALPATSSLHIKSFLLGGALGWALFMVKVRRAKVLTARPADKAGRGAGLWAMVSMGLIAIFLLLAWRNPQMDVLCAGLGVASGNVAVVAAGVLPALIRVVVRRT